jgi:hypothetical protein
MGMSDGKYSHQGMYGICEGEMTTIKIDWSDIADQVSDDDIKEEFENRGLDSACDCPDPDFLDDPFVMDALQKSAMNKAIDLMRASGDLANADRLNEVYEAIR